MNDPHIAEYHDFSFDESFSGIPYPPWIGKQYNGATSRILIIAESVYDSDPGSSVTKDSLQKATFVRHCVREIGLHFTMDCPWKGSETQKLYRGVERLVWNEKLVTDEQKLKLWTTVAFHELVQRPMECKKARPDAHDLKHGTVILAKLLKILSPNLCIFLGTDKRKLNALEEVFVTRAEWSNQKLNGAYPKTISLASCGLDCKIVMVKHPSQRFSSNLWSNYLEENARSAISSFRDSRTARPS